jgi:molybdopterin/thiamine biosynthesis adenylyltransferase
MNAPYLNLSARPKSVTVIGAGNIGSHLLPLVARMPAVGCVTIVDHDSYEEKNLVSQSISPADVGRPKASVQAARLLAIRPQLHVTPVVDRVENVPPGALRADVLLGCLDSRRSRRIVSSLAWRLGVPLIDAGVLPDGLLARIQVYRPDPANACLECAWDDGDYRAEQEDFSCDGKLVEPAATNAPCCLGALAAAMQAIELVKILAGDWVHVAAGSEVLLDACFHRHFVTRLPRNPACRFDHRTFAVRELRRSPDSLTLADLFATGSDVLRVEGQRFVRQWACASCQTAKDIFGLSDRIADSLTCPECGQRMRAIGFQTFNQLSAADVPDGLLTAPLSTLGFRAGDFLTGSDGSGEAHFEIINPPICQP